MKEKIPRSEIGKIGRLATNAAKTEITKWAEHFDEDSDRLAVAIVTSVQVATDMIDAAMQLDEPAIMVATLKQTDRVLIPMLERLRAKVEKGAVH